MKKLIAKFLIYLMFLSIGFSFGINANAEEIVLVDELQSSPDETINDSVGDVIEDDEDAIISDNSPASDEDNIEIYELSEETFSEANLEGSGFAEQSIDNEEVEANTLTLENEVVAEASELEISDPIILKIIIVIKWRYFIEQMSKC